MSNNTLKLLTLGASILSPKDKIKEQQTNKRLELKEREIQLKEATQQHIDYNIKVTPLKVSVELLNIKIHTVQKLADDINNYEHIHKWTKEDLKDTADYLVKEIQHLQQLLNNLI